MSYYLNKINPIPTLPEYTGPYIVGTIDVEIPISGLNAPSEAPENAADIHTIQFRIFYPAQPDSRGKRITWLPAPQRSHVSAYTKFLGFGAVTSEILSFFPRHVHYTTIPVFKNASILEPEHLPNKRWPTMIFSHGLGGNRNAYSHIVGSMASHGVVVICPEHRDGSAAVSFIRDPTAQNSRFMGNTRRVVPYVKISHDQNRQTWDARNQQLKVRLWELGLTHEAILDIDAGLDMHNLNTSTPVASLSQFTSKLDVQKPGSIIFGGHSFGAATAVQLLKSTYYAGSPELEAIEEPLYCPAAGSRIRAQITSKNPIMMLDMWCFPLVSPTTTALYSLPLPAYADNDPTAPGGASVLAIESETFFKWTEHLHAMCRIISPRPSAPVVSASAFERPGSGVRLPEPNFFYVINSAHLNQSDFGVLFPWLTKKVFGAEQPERALRLNVRAMLQLLRKNGVPVARTWSGDLVEGAEVSDKLDAPEAAAGGGDDAGGNDSLEDGLLDDKAIFDRSGHGTVDYWKWIDIVGMGGESDHSGKDGKPEGVEGESEMETEIEGATSPQPPTAVDARA
ncbi:PAF acetylhydrolase [Cryphonectria parasitica EP155]|uniref:Putative phospholipase n=1 Tax=Cryphonectria parasitica (strain ATCC 38755 / EP155) TaxID=660469 RepID=A0A9P4YD30_CRYP1|nr:PAF acetylhydrolase [Cryphonectria parasitica EP155]KAF3770759.1 PAF acetylhydrolase [Cryphonectria parasitica EP155]